MEKITNAHDRRFMMTGGCVSNINRWECPQVVLCTVSTAPDRSTCSRNDIPDNLGNSKRVQFCLSLQTTKGVSALQQDLS
jgi:uncharacterized protein YcbX